MSIPAVLNMDRALAERMHEVLAHDDGEHPDTCPVCRRFWNLSAVERERIRNPGWEPLPSDAAVPLPSGIRGQGRLT